MNYSKLLHGLIAEMKTGVQYKRIPQPFKAFMIIGMIPMIIAFVAQAIAYHVQVFFFKALSAPAEYLHRWLRNQKDEVEHATQAVMYFVCLPYIFFLQSLLAMASLGFFFSWFGLQVTAYLLTLGGTRFQAYISDATFDEVEEGKCVCTPNDQIAIIFACVVLGAVALNFLLGFVIDVTESWEVFKTVTRIRSLLNLVYWGAVLVVNPILFRVHKAEKTEEIAASEAAE